MKTKATVIDCQMAYDGNHRWMLIEGNLVLQEFFNCPSIRKKFKKLDKESPQNYIITIQHVSKDK